MLYAFVSKSQLRITLEATEFFRRFLPGLPIPNHIGHMFRQDGEGMSVSLTTDDGPDVFVARETISPGASLSDIHSACDRLIRTLLDSHLRVQLHNASGIH